MQQLIYIFKFLFVLVTQPENSWRQLAADSSDAHTIDAMQRNYYYPMLGGGALLLFFCFGFRETPFDIGSAMKGALYFLLSYFAGFYLAMFLIRELFHKFLALTFDKTKLHCFVGYSMSFILAVDVFIESVPSLKFLGLVSIYLAYIVWYGAEYYLNIQEAIRWKFTIFGSLILYFSPIIVCWIFRLMEPGRH